jgi:hypothetical protein
LAQATRLEFLGGLTTRVNDSLSFYGQAGYQFAVSHTATGIERTFIMADVGLRHKW